LRVAFFISELNMNKLKDLKVRDIGLITMIIIILTLLGELYLFFWGNFNQTDWQRVLIFITAATLGLSLRAIFHNEFYKPQKDESLKSYFYYWLMTILICGFLYMVFYDLFNRISSVFFYFITIIFGIMGLVIKTVIVKFGVG